jgi:hypothetical protein
MAIKQPARTDKVIEMRRRKLTVVVGGRANHLYGSMSNPPRIWLDYRPVRIGWVVDDPSVAALAAAAHFNSCLWGGRFNPIIPCRDAQLAAALVKLFNVDVLLPVQPTERTAALLGRWPHLRLNIRGDSIFHHHHCAFVDIRHAVKRARRAPGFVHDRFIRPTWTDTDPLAPLFSLMFGRYPDPNVITIDYVRGIRSELELPDRAIDATDQLAPELLESVAPLLFTGFDLTVQRDRSGWLAPGIVLGDLASFDDLLLFWNLRAAGAQLCFYDQAHSHRLKTISRRVSCRASPEARGRVQPCQSLVACPGLAPARGMDYRSRRHRSAAQLLPKRGRRYLGQLQYPTCTSEILGMAPRHCIEL